MPANHAFPSFRRATGEMDFHPRKIAVSCAALISETENEKTTSTKNASKTWRSLGSTSREGTETRVRKLAAWKAFPHPSKALQFNPERTPSISAERDNV